MRTVFFLSSLTFAITTAAFAEKAVPAAQLSDMSGDVLINTGEGFTPVATRDPVVLMPGHKIMVRDNSFATISYADCAIALAEPTVFTVTAKAPCEAGAPLPQKSVKITPTQSTSDENAHPELPFVRTAIVAGMLGGSAYVLIDAITDDEDDPVSGNGVPLD